MSEALGVESWSIAYIPDLVIESTLAETEIR